MRLLVALVGLATGLASASADAQALNVVQTQRANVFGVVQAGSQVRPVTITQTGQANIAGVIQASVNPRAAIYQNGRTNSAFIGQYENVTIPVGRSQMP